MEIVVRELFGFGQPRGAGAGINLDVAGLVVAFGDDGGDDLFLFLLVFADDVGLFRLTYRLYDDLLRGARADSAEGRRLDLVLHDVADVVALFPLLRVVEGDFAAIVGDFLHDGADAVDLHVLFGGIDGDAYRRRAKFLLVRRLHGSL